MTTSLKNLLLLASLGPASPFLAQAACTLNAVAVLPIREAGAPFVFTAKVNGISANLAVETGSDMTTLNLASGPRLDVDLHPAARPTYGVGGMRRSYYGRARRIDIGGMTATNLRIRGNDLWPAGARQGLDGHFGMDLMASYDVDLDIAGQHLVIYEADGACTKPNVALQQPLYMVDLVDIYHDKQADIDVVIDGTHFRALLDSGATHSSMLRSAALRLGIDAPERGAGAKTRLGFGPFEVAYAPRIFQSMRIGNLEFRNTELQVLSQNGTGIDRHRVGSLLERDDLSGGHEIILGADFMRKVHLWISHSSHKLIMQYPPQPSVLPH